MRGSKGVLNTNPNFQRYCDFGYFSVEFKRGGEEISLMPASCKYCKRRLTSQNDICSPCSILEFAHTGMLSSQFPHELDLEIADLRLSGTRGLSDYHKFAELTRFVTEDELPYGFRTKRGVKAQWGASDVQIWKEMVESIETFGEVGRGNYNLPDGSILTVGESRDYIDGEPLPNKLPLLDIATWLSNESRAWPFRDWEFFLRALSCASTYVRVISSWPRFFETSSWPGIDSPTAGENITETLPTPFMELVSMYCEVDDDDESSIGHIARRNPRAMEDIGGNASRLWMEKIEEGGHWMVDLHRQRVSPRLIVHSRSLHLVVLKGGRPSMVRVPVEPKFWKALVSMMLEPVGSAGSNLMRDVFWTWHSEECEWELNKSERRAVGLLIETVEGLGEDSSLIPIKCGSHAQGLFVRGRSGICYVIFGISDRSKFGIWAIPDVEDKEAAIADGIFICIDPLLNSGLPPGDIAIQYLLTLRDDISSSERISTLQVILECIDQISIDKEEAGVDAWWSEVCELYEFGGEYPHDDYEDDEEDEEWLLEEESGVDEPNLDEIFRRLQEQHEQRLEALHQEGGAE